MLSSKASCALAFLLAVTVSARPAEKRWGGGGWGTNDGNHWWQPSKSSSYIDFGKRAGDTLSSTCNIQAAVNSMPLSSVSPALPAPSTSLYQVAIGRGTQNYTCDLSNATATPVPIGAVATLFNVSCIAADMPELLQALPAIALDLPVPTTADESSPIYQDLSGHHYFLDSTTPFFNMDTSLHQYGMGALAKIDASDAPSDAVLGQNNQGHGAVQWLMLQQKPYAEDTWSQVYRLNTAGGNAPKMCTGMPASFEVQYAAEYWLFT